MALCRLMIWYSTIARMKIGELLRTRSFNFDSFALFLLWDQKKEQHDYGKIFLGKQLLPWEAFTLENHVSMLSRNKMRLWKIFFLQRPRTRRWFIMFESASVLRIVTRSGSSAKDSISTSIASERNGKHQKRINALRDSNLWWISRIYYERVGLLLSRKNLDDLAKKR